MDIMGKVLGNLGIDLFSMMKTFGTGKELFAFLKDRKAPDVYDSPEMFEKEIDGKTIHLIPVHYRLLQKRRCRIFCKV